MNYLIGLFLILSSGLFSNAFSQSKQWEFKTNGVVNAKPIIEGDNLYCGGLDKTFYAINSMTGQLLWNYNAPGEIKATAIIVDSLVIFNTQSVLVALNKLDGTLKWQYKSELLIDSVIDKKFDVWDYHSSSPMVYKHSILYGDDLGNIHSVNVRDGKGQVLLKLKSQAAIHSGLTVHEDVLYFGDWEGYVHAFNLNSKTFNWSFKSFESKPYPSYGPIITKPIISKNKLYVGARNYDFTVLNIADGSIAWQFNEPTGGWLTGTPLIVNDTLFMGCSDNKAMIAFNALSGKVYWKCKSNQNIFCEPTYTNGKLVFVDGDSYNHESGSGFLYVVESKTGLKLKEIEVGRNIYSSPTVVEDVAYFGCFDHKIYSINIFD